MEQDSFKRFKIFKMIQLGISIIFFIIYFLLLFFTPSFRANIYSNKMLFILCALLWLFMIYSFTTLIFDFHRLRETIASERALNRKAYLDRLTGIPNRYSCDLIFDTYKDASHIEEIGCLLISISNLATINKQQGHEAGDKILQDFSALLERVADSYGFVGRNGGNEFIVVLENCSDEKIKNLLLDIEKEIALCNMPVTIASAYVLNHNEHITRFTDLIALVYKKLAKQET